MQTAPEDYMVESGPGRTVKVKGSDFLFFSGYNYLGVNQDADFHALLLEGVSKYGWLFPSSRISNSRLGIFEDCEAFLAELCGSEESVLLPSGFAAGRMATSLYPDLYNAPGSHPAILRNASTFLCFDEWAKWFEGKIGSASEEMPVCASDSLNVLKPELYDFSFLKYPQTAVNVVLDDSHGIGLIGKDGKGISSIVPMTGDVHYLFSYSLSKSFGISGGAVCCSNEEAKAIRTCPEYTATTPVPPAHLYAFMNAQEIYARQRQKLHSNISFFSDLIKDIEGIRFVPGFPVFVLPASINAFVFQQENILISSFAYPDPTGEKLNRIVLNALHTQSDLEKIAKVLERAANYTDAIKSNI